MTTTKFDRDTYEQYISNLSDVKLITETAIYIGDLEAESVEKLDACKAECEERDQDKKYYRDGGRFNKAFKCSNGYGF